MPTDTKEKIIERLNLGHDSKTNCPLFVMRSLRRILMEEETTASTDAMNSTLALVAGWSAVFYSTKREKWVGIKPGEYEFSDIPNFLTSVDAAITVIPGKWVESCYRFFDGIVFVECHPRSDLGFSKTRGKAECAATAIAIAALDAHIMMKEAANG